MNTAALERLLNEGIPYQYEYDRSSALYFALAVVLMMLLYALVQALVHRWIS